MERDVEINIDMFVSEIRKVLYAVHARSMREYKELTDYSEGYTDGLEYCILRLLQHADAIAIKKECDKCQLVDSEQEKMYIESIENFKNKKKRKKNEQSSGE